MGQKANTVVNKTRKLFATTAGFLLAAVIMGSNFWIVVKERSRVEDHEIAANHTRDVIRHLRQLSEKMLLSETGERGFIITGLNEYFDLYIASEREARSLLTEIAQLVAANPAQVERLDALRLHVDRAFARYSEIIDLRRTQGFTAAEAQVSLNRGRRLIENVLEGVGSIEQEEERVLKERSQMAQNAQDAVDKFLIIAIVTFFAVLATAYFLALRAIQKQHEEVVKAEIENRFKGNATRLNEILRGNVTMTQICRKSLEFLCSNMHAAAGTFYLRKDQKLLPTAAYAQESDVSILPEYALGQSTVGEAAVTQRVIAVDDLANINLRVSTSIGDAPVRHVITVPITLNEVTKGVLELGSFQPFLPTDLQLLEYAQNNLGLTLEAAASREQLNDLLEETQRQAEELRMQQEELLASNEELEAQAHALKIAQDRGEVQQEELKQTNEELEQQAKILEFQKSSLEDRNLALRDTQAELIAKAKELQVASRYKSEFLANMSHELRTPLNSLLILSTLLYENENGNLDQKQVDFAKTINRAGTDLLNLINDILDLSKVEAGKLSIMPSVVYLSSVAKDLQNTFAVQAEQKGIGFSVKVEDAAPKSIVTDRQRLDQILKNLVSNAVKFTHSGQVDVTFSKGNSNGALEITVKDTGIGIPKDRLGLIFEAFQQGDGSSSRIYGGTGLGLTISRELANLLGCQISVKSTEGKGSTFTLKVPEAISSHPASEPVEAPTPASTDAQQVPSSVTQAGLKRESLVLGDVDALDKEDRMILIVEDDEDFGQTLLQESRGRNFKAVLTNHGEAALQIAARHKIAAVLLDLRLPDMSGLTVLERLKHDSATRHLPVHIVSARDRLPSTLSMGAIGYLVKPVTRDKLNEAFGKIEGHLSRQMKRILIVEDDPNQRLAMKELLDGADVEIDTVGKGEDAIEKITGSSYDCLIIDLRLPDMSGFDLLHRLSTADDRGSLPPVVVYTGKDLSPDEVSLLETYSETVILKGARSSDRLLDEVSLFLHRVESKMPQAKQTLLRQVRDKGLQLNGRRILVVDDDMRNVFALANALKLKGMEVIIAKNGHECLKTLENDREIEIVLMDIMMPGMDGYEAMRRIRERDYFRKLPIIALTAKAMKSDHDKCLAAGANDYLSKPVDLDKLWSLLKVWLPTRART
ncbi:MAG: response regulator [Oligoflexales bacterium]